MQGFVANLDQTTKENIYFRKVLYTARHSQLVVMSLKPGEDIGEEVHELDQFIKIEQGKGKAVLDGKEHEIEDGAGVVIPAGTRHNIINNSEVEMKLYTVYSPPEHKDGTIHPLKADVAEEHFDGKTTE
ncbi:cupin [Candidatus Falkowbacteria bacterium RBG_13_39_14]|uniref:Cupin n=1 Tax=Candidatus Falkowbacteria bacterium RBG_13_39_14 TaxID=1797985 RepID=A0A1F5S6W9_9BACT|nr:MAG: cupin [Candidatus Falkowbacteria bacterium RBG_13_39_14]